MEMIYYPGNFPSPVKISQLNSSAFCAIDVLSLSSLRASLLCPTFQQDTKSNTWDTFVFHVANARASSFTSENSIV